MINLASTTLGLVAFTMSGAISSQAGWEDVLALDEQVSFQMPCSAETITFREEGSDEFGSNEAQCTHEGVSFLVIVSRFPEGLPEPAFDGVVAKLLESGSSNGEEIPMTISGCRTHADREEDDEGIGQRAVVEVGPRKIAMFMAGGTKVPEFGGQVAMIDHFFNSVEVQS